MINSTKITTALSVNALSVATLCVLSLSFSLSAQAAPIRIIDATLEKQLIKICKAIKSNNQFKIKVALKNTHISMHDVRNDLKCNGMSAVDFALANNALISAKHLAPSSDSTSPKEDAKAIDIARNTSPL
jgi:hypothetical protein